MENHLSYPLHTLSDRWVVAYHGIVSVNATHKMIVVINQDRFDGLSSPCLFSFPVQADSIWCIVDRKYTSFLYGYGSTVTLALLLKALSPHLRLFLCKLWGGMIQSFHAVTHAAVPWLSKCWKSLRLVYQLSMYTW